MDDALRAGFSTLLSGRLVAFTGKHGILLIIDQICIAVETQELAALHIFPLLFLPHYR